MSATTMEMTKLADGTQMPTIGLGTWRMRDRAQIFECLDAALECGYRLIDTASVYKNEIDIGDALQTLLPKYGLRRDDIFLVSKLSPKEHGLESARQAALRSLAQLRTDYLDLYLIHFPGVSGHSLHHPDQRQLRQESWTALQTLRDEGRIRCIGVSNYTATHLEEMNQYSRVAVPAVNQCEYHPHWIDQSLIDYCQSHGIHFQAYGSLGSEDVARQRLFAEPLIHRLSKKYCCTEAQLLLAWALNQGISVLPKSKDPDRIRSNFRAKDIRLTAEDIENLSRLDTRCKSCWDSAGVL